MNRTAFPPATERANPFDSDLARRHSHYYGIKEGRAVLLDDTGAAPDLFASAAIGAFRGFVLNPDFSCVGAKSAVMHDACRIGVYNRLGHDDATTAGLGRDLLRFVAEGKDQPDDGSFRSFVAVFREPANADEYEFEQLLWDQLNRLNQLDAPLHPWDSSVSADPESPDFGFSFGGSAFFLVGLHPQSSRVARRFVWPTLVFNPHSQFRHLREAGRWPRIQQVVRNREQHLQGSLNPNLADHGTATEARQYSGRAVEADWHPPFPASGSVPAHASGCPFAKVMAGLVGNIS